MSLEGSQTGNTSGCCQGGFVCLSKCALCTLLLFTAKQIQNISLHRGKQQRNKRVKHETYIFPIHIIQKIVQVVYGRVNKYSGILETLKIQGFRAESDNVVNLVHSFEFLIISLFSGHISSQEYCCAVEEIFFMPHITKHTPMQTL